MMNKMRMKMNACLRRSPRLYALSSVVILVLFAGGCRKANEFPDTALDERMSGGQATVFDEGTGAYGHMIPYLTGRDAEFHKVGDFFFGASFVTAPAPKFSGLGPVYNAIGCHRCHVNEGRGKLPAPGQPFEGLFFRISLPGTDAHGDNLPVPGFGHQLQDKAIHGAEPEGNMNLQFDMSAYTLDDGTVVELRKPVFTLAKSYIPMPQDAQFSPRLARPLIGMGLLEAISEESILRHADPADTDGDGISGRPNYVYDHVTGRSRVLGRIGWKAGVPTLKAQLARALLEDIGLTTSVFPQKAALGQPQMQALGEAQGGIDIPDSVLNALTHYMATLAVPARRNVDDPKVLRGQALFVNIGCQKCHVDKHYTSVDVSRPYLSGQVIRPYTDMLLHDMGLGLADDRTDFEATGTEWRTPPLWGIGLTQRISGTINLLHDGRARSFTEAILWHGGEATNTRKRFAALSKAERDDLLAFLHSL